MVAIGWRSRAPRSRCSTWSRPSRARSRRWSAFTSTAGDKACATKLLWTRVQGGVTKALAGTTLADLVEFAGGAVVPQPQAQPLAEPVA
jgi:DNA-binding IscR family transcriptional regulator